MMPWTTTEVHSKWSGKVWSVIGDSNTEWNDCADRKYHDYIRERIGCTVHNYGLGGSGWFNSWNGNLAFFKRLDEVDPDSDLITVLGGGNDYAETEKPLVLGAFGDTDPNASFYGALDYTIRTLVERFPEKTVAVLTQFRRASGIPAGARTSDKLEAMVEAQKKVAASYAVPCLDLYHSANQYPWLESYRITHMPDGIHLNDLGQQKLAAKILPFLESL